ncbi:MAG: SGNH/GDSL hydrolase family protein, partial [Microcystaceae cyanobacterium]
KYQPDLVLLQIFTSNDIVNNSQALSPGDPQSGGETSRLAPFLIQKDGQWVMDTSFNQTETYRRRDSWLRRLGFTLINHSRVLQVINEAKRAFSTRQGLVATGNPGTKNHPQALIPALDFDVNLYREPQNKNWQSAWEATEALITLIHQEAKKH